MKIKRHSRTSRAFDGMLFVPVMNKSKIAKAIKYNQGVIE